MNCVVIEVLPSLGNTALVVVDLDPETQHAGHAQVAMITKSTKS